MIVNVNVPTSRAGIVPESIPVTGSIDSHDGAPESEKLGAGTPVALTANATEPVLESTDRELFEVICGAVGGCTMNVSDTEPSPGADAMPNVSLPITTPVTRGPPAPPPPPAAEDLSQTVPRRRSHRHRLPRHRPHRIPRRCRGRNNRVRVGRKTRIELPRRAARTGSRAKAITARSRPALTAVAAPRRRPTIPSAATAASAAGEHSRGARSDRCVACAVEHLGELAAVAAVTAAPLAA